MRIVGIDHGGAVQVAALSEDGSKVTVLAPLAQFWADPATHLATGLVGATVSALR